jgi:hypothetical protein
MSSVKLIYNFMDEKTRLADWVLDGLHRESHVFVDKIGPGRPTFEKVVKKYKVRNFPAIIVAGVAQRTETKIDDKKFFADAGKLREILAETFLRV